MKLLQILFVLWLLQMGPFLGLLSKSYAQFSYQEEAQQTSEIRRQTVWTLKDRDKSGLSTTETINQMESLQISGSGGSRAFPGVFLRGASGEDIVALWNGFELNDPSSPGGGVNPLDFQREFSHELRVSKGAENILLGTRALGGSIEWTREKSSIAQLMVEFDSHSQRKYLIEYQYLADKVFWGIGGTHTESYGVSQSAIGEGKLENDVFIKSTASGFLGYHLDSNQTIEFWTLWNEDHQDEDLYLLQDPDARSEFTQKGNRISYVFKNENLESGMDIQKLTAQRENRNDPLYLGGYLDQNWGEHQKAKLYWNQKWNSDFSTQVVYDQDTDGLVSKSLDDVQVVNHEQKHYGWGGVSLFQYQDWKAKFGLRTDRLERKYKSDLSLLSWITELRFENESTLSPYFVLSESKKFPTLYQLYAYPYGNPDLQDQKQNSFEMGLDYQQNLNETVSFIFFHNQYSQFIDFVGNQYQNQSQPLIYGVELIDQHNWNFGQLRFSISLLDIKNSKILLRRAKWLGKAFWSQEVKDNLNCTFHLTAIGERQDLVDKGSVSLEPALRAGFNLKFSFSRQEVKFFIDNIFNSGSPDAYGYTEPKQIIGVSLITRMD